MGKVARPVLSRAARVYGPFDFPARPRRLQAYAGLRDPYVGVVAASAYGRGWKGWPDLIDEMEEPPAVAGPPEAAVWWQVGRALAWLKEREGLTWEEVFARVGYRRHAGARLAAAVYLAWPDGKLPEGKSLAELFRMALENVREGCRMLFGRITLRKLSGEIEAAAMETPDPYLAAVLGTVKGYTPDQMRTEFAGLDPAPEAEGPEWFRPAWHLGRAITHVVRSGAATVRSAAEALGLHEDYARDLMKIYHAWPDGRLDDRTTWEQAVRHARNYWRAEQGGSPGGRKEGAGELVARGREIVRQLEAMKEAVQDLAALSRRVGRPLTCQEIESVARRHGVSPLRLKSQWGNYVHAHGGITTRDLVAVLQAELKAEKEELKSQLEGLKAQLASLEDIIRGMLNVFQAFSSLGGRGDRPQAAAN